MRSRTLSAMRGRVPTARSDAADTIATYLRTIAAYASSIMRALDVIHVTGFALRLPPGQFLDAYAMHDRPVAGRQLLPDFLQHASALYGTRPFVHACRRTGDALERV